VHGRLYTAPPYARNGENMPEPFMIQVSEAEVKKEREKARLLRRTRWWKQRLARGLCYYCQRRFPPAGLTMDHIVPLIRGGKTTKGNVVAVCQECNRKKKYLLPMEWEAYVQDSLGSFMKNGRTSETTEGTEKHSVSSEKADKKAKTSEGGK